MDIDAAIRDIRQSGTLSIIRLAEPIFASRLADNKDGNRVSNASSTASELSHDPAVMRADLQHYRDLFAKLRFSYVEQVTKEKFLRTITDEAPQLVTSEENAALDEHNKQQKALLKERKEELSGMLQDLEAQGRELARRYHEIELRTTQLEMLPVELEELESKIADLEAQKEPQSEDLEMRLPLHDTLALLEQREQEELDLDAQIQALQASLEDKHAETRTLAQELDSLKSRKDAAVEYMQMSGAGRKDAVALAAEYQSRWLASSESALKMMLEV